MKTNRQFRLWKLSNNTSALRINGKRGAAVVLIDRAIHPLYSVHLYDKGKKQRTFRSSVREEAIRTAYTYLAWIPA